MTSLFMHPTSQDDRPCPNSATSPSKASTSNPFARPKSSLGETFSRATLLPTHPSPKRAGSRHDGELGLSLNTPEKRIDGRGGVSGSGSALKRQGWRHLWRGGLEIGPDGWRLDGITFYALLSFPPTTPSTQTSNPFDVAIQPFPTPDTSTPNPPATSPFPSLPSADTDLCLSLESMRGRKYLQVRGVIDLSDGDIIEGNDEGGVQMSISPQAPLLAAYFTTLLCRSSKLSSKGRTLSAIVLGLGDEDVETPLNSLIVYGQLESSTMGPDTSTQGILKLRVGRKRPPSPPASAKKIRPGEPLPRAPLFLPTKNSSKPLPPYSRGGSLSRAKSFSRTTSVSSIYLPPPPPVEAQIKPAREAGLSKAPVSGRTPGRRGEKRSRARAGGEEEDSAKKRKHGKIVLEDDRSQRDRSTSTSQQRSNQDLSISQDRKVAASRKSASVGLDDEDIFGRRAGSVVPPSSRVAFDTSSLMASTSNYAQANGHARPTDTINGEPPSTGKGKRIRVPQQVLDNKATIRKQAMVMLEIRGCARDHVDFKEIFGMTTKGAYFAFRDRLHQTSLTKTEVLPVINTHLDMYWTDGIVKSPAEPENDALHDTDDSERDPDQLMRMNPEHPVSEEESEDGCRRDERRVVRSASEGTLLEFIKEEPEDGDD